MGALLSPLYLFFTLVGDQRQSLKFVRVLCQKNGAKGEREKRETTVSPRFSSFLRATVFVFLLVCMKLPHLPPPTESCVRRGIQGTGKKGGLFFFGFLVFWGARRLCVRGRGQRGEGKRRVRRGLKKKGEGGTQNKDTAWRKRKGKSASIPPPPHSSRDPLTSQSDPRFHTSAHIHALTAGRPRWTAAPRSGCCRSAGCLAAGARRPWSQS